MAFQVAPALHHHDGLFTTAWKDLLAGGVITAAVTILIYVLDRIRSRPRFGVSPVIDNDGKVVVDLVKKGDGKGYVETIRIVAVKSRLFRWVRRIHYDDEATNVDLLGLGAPGRPLEPSEPFQTCGVLPETRLLPPRRNPFAGFAPRAWTRSEVRAQVKVSIKHKPRYFHLRHKRGSIEPWPPIAVARSASPPPNAQ